jgi:DNA-binding GntR family transcriptional regulator
VYEALVELIVTRTLKPGQHLVEGDLAEQLGVSRQPVREALQRLQGEGWVDLRPAHGAFVHEPTVAEVDQLLDVRALLEAESARLAALMASAADVKELRRILRTGKAALAAGDMARVVAANSEFHGTVSRIAGNDVLGELIDLVERRVRWYYRPLASTRGVDAWREHTELVDAIAQRDDRRAAAVMQHHTEMTRRAAHAQLDADDQANVRLTRRR